MKNLFSFLLLFLSIESFAQNKNVKITTKALGSTNDISVKTTLDAQGNAVLEIQLSKPIFVEITIGTVPVRIFSNSAFFDSFFTK